MRMFVGIGLGCALTVGGVYIADHMDSAALTRPMVNWDIVAKNLDGFSTMARDGWKKISG